MKKIIKHYPITGRCIVTRGYVDFLYIFVKFEFHMVSFDKYLFEFTTCVLPHVCIQFFAST